jgi:hypothetical protein
MVVPELSVDCFSFGVLKQNCLHTDSEHGDLALLMALVSYFNDM